jgi:spermidine/putrescine transport system permease protein
MRLVAKTRHPFGRGWMGAALFLGPALLYMLCFMLLPYTNILQYSVWRVENYAVIPDFNVDNYLRILRSPTYLSAIRNSLEVAAIVTVISTVLGYLLAFYAVFFSGRARPLLYFLIVIPLWTSFLLRAFIWRIILGREGIINGALVWLGVIHEPLSILLFNRFSLCIALVYVFIPFIALPVYAALEKIPREAIEASMDLGANPLLTFWRVILPLSMSGVITGASFTFCLSFGDFVAPMLLGGPGNLMISSVIISQFGSAFDWPFGSALAVVVIAVIGLSITALAALEKRHA